MSDEPGSAGDEASLEEQTLQLDMWEFRIGAERAHAAVILDKHAWLVTGQLLAPAEVDGRERRYRLYRQQQGYDGTALLVDEWTVGETPDSLVASGDGERAIIVWRELMDGESVLGWRVIHGDAPTAVSWLHLPSEVSPKGSVFVTARSSEPGWIVCLETFESEDVGGVRCIALGPTPGETGPWSEVVAHELTIPHWLGPISGTPTIVVADGVSSVARLAAVPLRADASPAGEAREIASYEQPGGATVHIIETASGVVVHDSKGGQTLAWDGGETRTVERVPGAFVSLVDRDDVYLVRGGTHGYSGLVRWDETGDAPAVELWPPHVHDFLGLEVARHVVSASPNGALLMGDVDGVIHSLILRLRR